MKTAWGGAVLVLSAVAITSLGCGGSPKPPPAEEPIGLAPSTADTTAADPPTPTGPTQIAADATPPAQPDDSTSTTPAPASGDVQVGQHAPDLALDALGSSKIPKLSALAGKTVVVHFWASWCTPCKKEMADLDALAAKHKKNLVVIGVSVDDDKQSADAFLSANKVKFANGFDSAKAAAKAWGLHTMPTTFVVDKKGNLSTILQGSHADDVPTIAKKL